MNHACPVTRAYLARVRVLVDFSSALNETYLDRLESLEEQAARAGAALERQHQRAFFCLEVTLSHLAERSIYAGELQQVPTLRWPRSREGIQEALRTMRSDYENLLAATSEYVFLPEELKGDTKRLYNDNQQRLLVLYRKAYKLAVILRRSLFNHKISLARVGRYLADAMHSTRQPVPFMLSVANQLIEQTEGWAPRAWQIQLR